MSLLMKAELDITDKFRDFIAWTSLEGWNYGGDGAAINACGVKLEMATGTTVNNEAWLYSINTYSLFLDTGKKVTIEFVLNWLTSIVNQIIWLRLAATYAFPPSETAHHIGWKIIEGDLYASNANGTTQTITDTTVDLATGALRARLKIVLNPGTDCKFYVNDVLKVTHLTNLPTDVAYAPHLHMRTLEAAQKYLELNRILIEKEHS